MSVVQLSETMNDTRLSTIDADAWKRLPGTAHQVDAGRWLDAAPSACEVMPWRSAMPRGLFRRHSGLDGRLLLQGFPVTSEELPATPSVSGSALVRLGELFDSTAQTVRVTPGDLAIVDTRVTGPWRHRVHAALRPP